MRTSNHTLASHKQSSSPAGSFSTSLLRFVSGLSLITATFYWLYIALFAKEECPSLYILLLGTQCFRLWQFACFASTLWARKLSAWQEPLEAEEALLGIDLFITTVGEDLELLERTIRAALAQNYPKFLVWVLNDARATGRSNWREVTNLAHSLGVNQLCRDHSTGGKAGNLNNALRHSTSPFVAILDMDHIPRPDFLRVLMSHVNHPAVAAVQSPQCYSNSQSTAVSSTAWEQQRLFYNVVLNAKDAIGCAFLCGTNMLIRRAALDDVGGFDETSVAEDFATSILLSSSGWRIRYVPFLIAEGLAPEDMPSYYRQQLRWASGSLIAAVRTGVWNRPGLSRVQQTQFAASAAYYLSGCIALLESLFPLFYLFLGLRPISGNPALGASALIVFVGSVLYLLRVANNGWLSLYAVTFNLSCFPLHIHALIRVLMGTKFEVTSKQRITGNHLKFAIPHLAYCLAVGVGSEVALIREGPTIAMLISLLWALFNVACFLPFIACCLEEKTPKRRYGPSMGTQE